MLTIGAHERTTPRRLASGSVDNFRDAPALSGGTGEASRTTRNAAIEARSSNDAGENDRRAWRGSLVGNLCAQLLTFEKSPGYQQVLRVDDLTNR